MRRNLLRLPGIEDRSYRLILAVCGVYSVAVSLIPFARLVPRFPLQILIFGALYALYTRAQRDNPGLQGKLVLEITIAPSGEVTNVRVVSSELGDPELERKIVARAELAERVAQILTVATSDPAEFELFSEKDHFLVDASKAILYLL